MSYQKTRWSAREGTKLNRFEKQNETSTHVELVNDPETVSVPGTPFSVPALKNIESGIYGGDHGYSIGQAAEDFAELSTTDREWSAVFIDSNGGVYACEVFGDIYRWQPGETGFTALGLTSQWWTGITKTSISFIACSQNTPGGDPGNIFDIDVGAGSATSRGAGTEGNWTGIAFSPSINRIYAVARNDDVYWLDSSSTVAAQGHGSKDYTGIAADDSGAFVISTNSSGLFIMYTFPPGSSTTLNPLPDAVRQYTGIAFDISTGFSYVSDTNQIYRKTTSETVHTLYADPTTAYTSGVFAADGQLAVTEDTGGVYVASRSIGQAYSYSIGDSNIPITAGLPEGTRRRVFATNSVTVDFPTGEQSGLTSDTIPANTTREYIKASATEWYISNSGNALLPENNLSDVDSAVTARDNLGLGTSATRDVTTSPTDTTTGRVLQVGDGGLQDSSSNDLIIDDDNDLSSFQGLSIKRNHSTGSTLSTAFGGLPGTSVLIGGKYSSNSYAALLMNTSPTDPIKKIYLLTEYDGSKVTTQLYHTGNAPSDDAWTETTSLLNGWTGTVRYKMVLGWVAIDFDLIDGSASTTDVVLTMPSSYRPDDIARGTLSRGDDDSNRMVITTGGNINIIGTKGTQHSGSITYPVV